MNFSFKPIMPLRGALLLFLVVLGGCGIISDKSVEYKKSQTLPTLEIPPPLTLSRDDELELPKGAEISYTDYDRDSQQRGTASRDSGVLDLPKGMRLRRDGNNRWLEVNENAEVLWPKLRQFWFDNGFKISREAPRLGIIETDWAENRAAIPSDLIRRTIGRILDFAYDSGYRDKYRMRLEPGENPASTEIYISHQGVEEVSHNNNFVWQPRPSDPGLEAEMLKRLMVVLGADEKVAETTIVGSGEVVAPKIKVEKDQAGQFFIAYPAAFAETWRQVGLALDHGGFTVEDRNREAGDYYIRYVGKETVQGRAISKLAFWRDREAETKRIYVLHLSTVGTQTHIHLLQEDKQAVEAARAESILQIVGEHLR
jgi:outer membrane protein assembly factor BamC